MTNTEKARSAQGDWLGMVGNVRSAEGFGDNRTRKM